MLSQTMRCGGWAAVGWWGLLGLLATEHALGQMAGSGAGMEGQRGEAIGGEQLLGTEVATRYITVTGTAERTVAPTEMRMIWAITAEDEQPQRCREILREQVGKVSTTWRDAGVAPSDIAEDFISALPRFGWFEEVRGERNYLIEKRNGYRIQTNLHVRVRDEQQALRVVDAALAAGVTDLIGVDYVADLAAVQREAQAAALAAAQAKSEVLLKPLFATMPEPINVADRIEVRPPGEQYASFENVAAEEYESGWNSDWRRIRAYRPRNTYYRGSTAAADDRAYELPMQPQIVVRATVQIYYLSPAATRTPPPTEPSSAAR